MVTLDTDLQKGVSSIDTILGQCMYFGLSFSRVGADFRTLMIPIFVKTILKNFTSSILKVTEQFESDMESYTFINKMSIPIYSGSSGNTKSDTDPLAPPEILLNFQPLALYCNGVLMALNDLQHCSPVACANDITISLQRSLERVSISISSFYRQEQQALGAKERDNFIKFCCAFAYDLIPFIQRCLHDIFSVGALTTHLGINAMTLQKEGLSYLKKKNILDKLDHLLPDKVESLTKSVAEVTVQ